MARDASDDAWRERRLAARFDDQESGVAITTADGRYLEANATYVEMLGTSLDELRETDLFTVLHPDDVASLRAALHDLVASGGASFHLEIRHRSTKGGTIWTKARVSLIQDATSTRLFIATTTAELTTQRLAADRLRRSESLRRLAGRMALVGGWSIEATDRRVSWSDEIYRILDAADGEEPAISGALARYSPDDRVLIEAALEACLVHGTPFEFEVEVTTYAGRRIPVRIIAEAQYDDHGEIIRVVGALQDISDLRRATEAAERSARSLLTTLESMTDAFYTLDREWRFGFVNERASELIQRSAEDVIGKSVWVEFPETVGSEVDEAYHRAMALGETQVIEDFFYPPLSTWFDIYAYPSPQGLAVYFRDITASRAARMALEEREATLRRQAALLDQAQDSILVREIDHTISYWNRGAERIYGWTSAEALGADVRMLLYDDPTAFEAATAELLQLGYWRGELTQLTRAGAHVIVLARWTLVRGADGSPEAVLSINTDITEQRRLEQELLRSQRMESIGTLAGGIAHDLNNVLSPVMLATELLQMQAADDETRELLGIVELGVRRGADLVEQVLSFARGVDGPRGAVDIAALLGDINVIVRDTFPKNLVLEMQCPATLRPVLGDSTQIQQVLLNLAVNARDAMPGGGTLRIVATEVDVAASEPAATSFGAAAGRYVVIEVEDTGIGMPPAVLARVFEPFFTTKPQGAGTGLGLSTAAAIVRRHGGALTASSEPGRGSRFRLSLPCISDAAPSNPTVVAAAPSPRGRGETILVVDDEEAVRVMTRRTLEANGYRTLEADNGEVALARFREHADRIDVVLTDMMMPVMDGPALISELLLLSPGLPIIGASGLHGAGTIEQAVEAGLTLVLPKPFSAGQLLDMVKAALGDRT